MGKAFGKYFVICVAIVFMAIFGATFFVNKYFKAYSQKERVVQEVVVEIPYGSSLRQVARLLSIAGVIEDAKEFYWYLRLGRNDGHRMQAGFYNFSGKVNPSLVASRLLFGVDQSFKLVFKEGESLKDLARKIEELGLGEKSAFLATARGLENVLTGKNVGIEGYLFPDTYYFSKKDKAEGIIKKMNARLLSKLNPEILARISELNTNLHEVLTLASIIEKETGNPSERPIIASVYKNRLRIGMRLQADPTVIYGIEDYDGKIRKKDLLKAHPYNTYKITGFPPGPIASAGIEAIRAALWPIESKFLYFVSKNDGSHIFCGDLSCHNRAVLTWQIEFFKKTAIK